jgi:RND family efflux transporter MFP subunit
MHRLTVLVGYASIQAPFDGVITKRWVDRGATVKDTTTPLLTVMRTDMVRILLDVAARDVPLLNATQQNPNPDGKGDPVEFTLPGLRGLLTEGRYVGHVTRMALALDPVTRTMRTEVHLDNRAGQLRPGMYGTAVVLLDARYNVFTVPSTALRRRGHDVELLHVADAKGEPPRGMVRRAPVEFGYDDGARVEVRGLTGNELIVAKGNGIVREGDEVIAVRARGTP